MRTITVFAPVPEQALDELADRLDRMRTGPSPFAVLPGTHFARLAILRRDQFGPQPRPRGMRPGAWLLDLVTHAGRPQRADPPAFSYLVFSANYDAAAGTRDDLRFVEQLRIRLREHADQIWGLCGDYPGHADRAGFAAFFTARSLPPAGYVFPAAAVQPTVRQVQEALALRRRVIRLAVDTDDLPEDQLAKQLRQVFGEGRPATGDPGTAEPDATVIGPLPAGLGVEPVLLDPVPGPGRLGHGHHPATEPDLADVQNLVTSGYPRHLAARHLLLRITDPPAARAWLARVAGAIPTAAWAEHFVDRIEGPADDTLPDDPGAGAGPAAAPDFAVHVALSYAGLVRLGLPETDLAGFGTEFQVGMAGREAGLAPGRGVGTWRAPFAPGPESPGVHVLLLLSALDQDTLDARLGQRPEVAAATGLQVLDTLEAGRIPIARPEPAAGAGAGAGLDGGLGAGDTAGATTGPAAFREHFGFADGLSQPRIHGVTAGRRTAELPAGEALLGYRDVDGDTAGAGLPAGLGRNGSYLVYRRLEQDVPAFRELTRRLGRRLEAKLAGAGTADPRVRDADPEELAAAKLIGRWRDGTPLTLSPEHGNPALAQAPFTFQDQDAQGLRCPVGAHVRRVNPRDSRPVDPDSALKDGAHAGLETSLALRHRMLRRGIPYGTPLPEGDESGTDAGAGAGADDERGLAFIALVGDIRRQFEFIQAHWMADGNAFRLGDDQDVLSGAALQDTKVVVQGTPPTFIQPARPLITCRGGEYFFLPGIAALRRIAAG